MRTKLLLQALSKFIAGFLMMGAFLFLPAGTLEYKNAWLFLAMLFIPMFILGCILFVKAPRLLEKRLRSKEKEKQQKHVFDPRGIRRMDTDASARLIARGNKEKIERTTNG